MGGLVGGVWGGEREGGRGGGAPQTVIRYPDYNGPCVFSSCCLENSY